MRGGEAEGGSRPFVGSSSGLERMGTLAVATLGSGLFVYWWRSRGCASMTHMWLKLHKESDRQTRKRV